MERRGCQFQHRWRETWRVHRNPWTCPRNDNGSRNSRGKVRRWDSRPWPTSSTSTGCGRRIGARARTGRWAWTDRRRGLRGGTGGQPPVAAGTRQVRHVPGTAGAAGPYPQGGHRRPRPGRWGSRPSRIRCCSVRSSWCWSRSTSRTSRTARTASGRDDRRTKPWRASGSRRWRCGGGWIVDVDIRKFFDTIDHGHLRELLQRRVRDGVLLRLIGKWLNAGVLEDGMRHASGGRHATGRGDLARCSRTCSCTTCWTNGSSGRSNRVCKGRAFLIRYADDFVMGFTCEEDARRVMDVLPKRFEKYGLTIHPEKTRLVPFERPSTAPGNAADPRAAPRRDLRPAGVHPLLGPFPARAPGW